jgi:hypothetical protein
MGKLTAIVLIGAIYVAWAALSWLVIGRWIWDGSGLSQVVSPGSMTVFTMIAAEGSLRGIAYASRNSRFAAIFAAILALLLAVGAIALLNG